MPPSAKLKQYQNKGSIKSREKTAQTAPKNSIAFKVRLF